MKGKMKILNFGSNKQKKSEKDLNKIEAKFAENKQKLNALKIKLRKC